MRSDQAYPGPAEGVNRACSALLDQGHLDAAQEVRDQVVQEGQEHREGGPQAGGDQPDQEQRAKDVARVEFEVPLGVAETDARQKLGHGVEDPGRGENRIQDGEADQDDQHHAEVEDQRDLQHRPGADLADGHPDPPGHRSSAGGRRIPVHDLKGRFAPGHGYPFTTPTGRRRATLRDRPAPSHASTTCDTSLYAYGASSASRRHPDAATVIPRSSREFFSSAPVMTFFAFVRLMARPAPWHVEANDRSAACSVPTRTYDDVPMLPGMITGGPTGP